jgi:L-threonylcarbamoyladenylate synthase
LTEFDAAIDALRGGQAIVLPTDTVYGIAVLASVAGSTQQLFSIKERPADVPLPVLVADAQQGFALWEEVPAVAHGLVGAWWPGKLTIVLPRAASFTADIGGAGRTVGVRAPAHHVPRALAARLGPLVTTSANRHGRPTPATAAAVAAELGDRVALVIDGGVCDGAPSTVVDCTGGAVRVLREGAIPATALLP